MQRLNTMCEGQGPRLLFLHGIGSSGTAWSKQIERLRDEFTCIALDMPGYGGSADLRKVDLDTLVDEVADVLNGATSHIVGVSFGALAALGLARRHPGLVRSLTLADATLGKAGLADAPREQWLATRSALSQGLDTLSRERAAQIAAPAATAEVIDEIAAHMRRARPEGYMAVARIIAATDARPWLKAIDVPALVICGECDSVTGLEVSGTLASELRDARRLNIANAGHAPHIEAPDQFAAAVREFVREVRATLSQERDA
jgi:3-oxoadipate enol-lactonase